MSAPLRLYSTLTREVSDFVPLEPGKVRLYVCGMTVYDSAHVGHARAMVVFDSFARWLRNRGWQVNFVRNFTDVDDKIIDRATKAGVDPLVWAERYINEFHRDVAALGLAAPDVEPRVSECIDDIVAIIGRLVDKGHAYESAGSVWFSVPSCPEYGKLSHQKVEELRNADTGDKRDPGDFALWKGAKPGEPAWPSPWGNGRPGWHIECSAMIHKVLGDTIDIHGGGLDLVFPHHENEVAQSECATGAPFARYWMHNGLLTMAAGQKMGKSLGNVVNIADALGEFPAEALRLYYLQNHYRSPLPWSADALPEALAMVARLYEARFVAEQMGGDGDPIELAGQLGPDAIVVYELGKAFAEDFHAALSEDFNTSAALGLAFELARAINRLGNHKKAKAKGGPVVAAALNGLSELASIGLLTSSYDSFQDEVKDKRLAAAGNSRAEIEQMLADRAAARASKDWAKADELRAALDARSILVMDLADGVRWRVRLEATDAG
jgi:cysteinyl-tRNA synthetase